jgi:hypothetical protein
MCLKNFKFGRQLGRQRCILDDNIKMNATELGCGGIDWVHLAQEMVQSLDSVNTAPQNVIILHNSTNISTVPRRYQCSVISYLLM